MLIFTEYGTHAFLFVVGEMLAVICAFKSLRTESVFVKTNYFLKQKSYEKGFSFASVFPAKIKKFSTNTLMEPLPTMTDTISEDIMENSKKVDEVDIEEEKTLDKSSIDVTKLSKRALRKVLF